MKRIIFFAALFSVVSNSPVANAASDNGLVAQVAKETKVSEDQAQQQVDAVFSALRSELLAGRDVTIKNFGRFEVTERQPRTGRNPKTGEAIEIGARRYPHFVSSDKLKETFNPEPSKKMASAAPASAVALAPATASAVTAPAAAAVKAAK